MSNYPAIAFHCIQSIMGLIFLSMLATLSAGENVERVNPLQVGAMVPDVTLRNPDGSPVNLRALLHREGPAVVFFYRGGWCPYCTRQLSDMQTVESELAGMGVQLLAISPDRPEKLSEVIAGQSLRYRLLSDSSAEAIRSFGVGFQMRPEQVTRYLHQYAIDIEADSGASHHLLPVPAVFLVDKSGEIVFRHYNADYKSRISGREVLTKAASLLSLE